MTLLRALLIAHAAALLFGLVGILVMIPNPQLWAGNPLSVKVFAYSMQYAGALHIILGAAAMLAFGGLALGWRNTLIFFVLSSLISLGAELIGTGTGWPFGNYEYTEGLGTKILGQVPFSIPLSWFYMGLASYLLGAAIAHGRSLRHATAWSVGLGAYFMVAWDLVLDPAMAAPSLSIQFWTWRDPGPYFGMPLINFLGWGVTAALFMGLSRLLWRDQEGGLSVPTLFPLAIYSLNMLFGAVLSAAALLWEPIILGVLLGMGPAVLAWRQPRPHMSTLQSPT